MPNLQNLAILKSALPTLKLEIIRAVQLKQPFNLNSLHNSIPKISKSNTRHNSDFWDQEAIRPPNLQSL